MQHALMIARRLLGQQRYGTAASLDDYGRGANSPPGAGLAYFNYPPSWRTIEQTLLEVKRCTKEGIIINTFMMEQDPYLMRFVQEMTRINRGRAFFSSPSHLGEYIVTDYISNKRRRAYSPHRLQALARGRERRCKLLVPALHSSFLRQTLQKAQHLPCAVFAPGQKDVVAGVLVDHEA